MSTPTKLTLTVGGAISNNNDESHTEAAVSYVIEFGENSVLGGSEHLGYGPYYTNNVADYRAIRVGINRIYEDRYPNNILKPNNILLTVQSDNKSLVHRLSGDQNDNNRKLQQEHDEATDALSAFSEWDVAHVSEALDDAVSIANNSANNALEH